MNARRRCGLMIALGAGLVVAACDRNAIHDQNQRAIDAALSNAPDADEIDHGEAELNAVMQPAAPPRLGPS